MSYMLLPLQVSACWAVGLFAPVPVPVGLLEPPPAAVRIDPIIFPDA